MKIISSRTPVLNYTLLLILIAMLPSNARAISTATSKPDTQKLSVQLKETKLRSSPKIFGTGLTTLHYGDVLSPEGAQDGWIQVRTTSGLKGFVHPSAVTEKRIILSSKTQAKTTVDPTQVVLAGKGFSKEIEKQFATQNPTADFRKVNQVEAIRVSQTEAVAFIKAGKLGKGAV